MAFSYYYALITFAALLFTVTEGTRVRECKGKHNFL